MSLINDIYEFIESFRHIKKLTFKCLHLENAIEHNYIYLRSYNLSQRIATWEIMRC